MDPVTSWAVGAAAANQRRLLNSPSSSTSPKGTLGMVRQLFTATPKASKQAPPAGSPSLAPHQLMTQRAPPAQASPLGPRLQLSQQSPRSSRSPTIGNTHGAGGTPLRQPPLSSRSPITLQQAAAEAQQLAGRLQDLRASAEMIKCGQLASSCTPPAPNTSGSSSSPLVRRSPRLCMATAGHVMNSSSPSLLQGVGSSKRQQGTPLSRKLFASVNGSLAMVSPLPRTSSRTCQGADEAECCSRPAVQPSPHHLVVAGAGNSSALGSARRAADAGVIPPPAHEGPGLLDKAAADVTGGDAGLQARRLEELLAQLNSLLAAIKEQQQPQQMGLKQDALHNDVLPQAPLQVLLRMQQAADSCQ
eukprot:gene13613-13738_t